MKMRLHRLAYFSRNAVAGSRTEIDDEVSRILETSRRNNKTSGITGALLFNDSCFAQILEGDLQQLELTFERIQRDPRHDGVTVLEITEIAERGFPGWSMALAGRLSEDRANFPALRAASVEKHASATQIFDLLYDLVVREEGTG